MDENNADFCPSDVLRLDYFGPNKLGILFMSK